jgi:molybdate transport system substrate-binding protein
MNLHSITAAAEIGLLFLVMHGVVGAAEFKVLSAVAMKSALDDLAPQFERATGHKLTISYAVAGELRKRIEGGEFGDMTILPKPWFEPLLAQGKITEGSQMIVARSTVGVSVRAGTPKPDISSVEAVRRSLLAAKSIVYGDPAKGGASGIHFVRVLEKLGIVEEMRPKTILIPGAGAAEVVARGEAQLAISQTIDLIRVTGADYVGPLPSELQNTTDFVFFRRCTHRCQGTQCGQGINQISLGTRRSRGNQSKRNGTWRSVKEHSDHRHRMHLTAASGLAVPPSLRRGAAGDAEPC